MGEWENESMGELRMKEWEHECMGARKHGSMKSWERGGAC